MRVPKKDLKQYALDHIHTLLMSGKLKWGDRVSEEAIAAVIGVSRTPVREALHTFTELGIFQRVHRYGTIVRTPEVREVDELFEVRVALETYAVAEAILHISVDELEKLRESCELLRQLGEKLKKSKDPHLSEVQVKQLYEADHAFHMGIIRAPGNRMLLRQIGETRMLLRILGGFHLQRFGEANIEDIYNSHIGILKAIEAKDTETAVRLLKAHIRDSKSGSVTFLKKYLDQLEEEKGRKVLSLG